MNDQHPSVAPSDWDQLVSRPADPLPTVLDPGSAEARGAPADPKPDRKKRPELREAEPVSAGVDRTA